ncbi:2-acyl-glycerophospho-ethanolamine acyltransferase [compost metagenome]
MKIFTLNRNLNLLIIGQIITLFGSSILRFALSLFILDITGSAGTFAFILAVSTIPTIFLSPIGGAIADRVNRRNLLVILDLISGLIVAGLAFFLFSGVHSILLIGIVMTLLSIVSTFYQPTVQASIPVLIENDHLLKANGVVSGVSALTNFAGPVLGGLLYSFQGIEWIVVMTSVSFFLCAVVETFMYRMAVFLAIRKVEFH